ncbi:YhgE/Pip family protein [Lactococcus sp.]|uniref:YhgE/Pip family protein n=1 Tax=Lactococcus sp. TaxID=44273 RepID=UPI0035B1B8D1
MNMTKQEWKNLFKNKILLISVIAITFIPTLYSTIFDKSVWDPYGRAKDLPVAVVNQDKSVKLLGEDVSVGADVVDNLKKNHDLDWNFVSESEATKGVKSNKYYMVITIPEDFSESAASIVNKDPKKMKITYTTNGSLNYIAEEISKVGATTLDSQIREQVIASYVTAVGKVAKQLEAGIVTAADGSAQLSSGTFTLGSGLNQYTAGVATAATGADQLKSGLGTLSGSIPALSSGVSQLDKGSNQISAALNEVNSKVQPLSGKTAEIQQAATDLSKGSSELATALQEFEGKLSPAEIKTLETQLQNLDTEITNLVTNTQKLSDISTSAHGISTQLDTLSTSLNNFNADLSTQQTAMNTAIDKILNDSVTDETLKNKLSGELQEAVKTQITEAQDAINTKAKKLGTEASNASTATQKLANEAQLLADTTNGLAASANSVKASLANTKAGIAEIKALISNNSSLQNSKTLVQGLDDLSQKLNLLGTELPTALSAVNTLATGSTQLSNGLDSLQGQIPTLASGVTQLNSGAGQLDSGMQELVSKNSELNSGVKALEDGAQELAKGLESGAADTKMFSLTKKTVDQVSAPTNLVEDDYSNVSNYGEALAPYIMSLALFVGCMLFNFIYPIRKVSLEGQSSISWWASKAILGIVVASAMAIIEVLFMLMFGLPVDNMFMFVLTALATAWCYMGITMFLAMTFDNPGRFVAMILLVLQLGGAGGTFPVQLQANFYQNIHPYLPMSYSVYSFRNAISGGIDPQLVKNSILILLILFVLFELLLMIGMNVLKKKHLENVSKLNDNQKLMELES